jgi:MFS family permease
MTSDAQEAQRTTADETASPALATLGKHRDFNLLWVGQSVSMLGSSVSSVALPITAVIFLQATAFQVGLLTFMESVAYLPLSLFAGVLVDRLYRRPLMIISDLGRGVVIGLIPVLALADVLNMETLYACVLVAGVLTVLFDIAYQAFVPSLLPESLLIRGNGRLELSRHVTGLAGPGIAGAAIAAFQAPLVIAADAVSYLVSAVSLLLIRKREPAPGPSSRPAPRQVLSDIWEGIDAVFGNRYIRPVALNATAFNFLSQMILTLFVLYATRDMGVPAGWIGLIFTAGSLGGVAGSLLIGRAIDRFTFGPSFLGGMILMRAALLCIGLVRGPQPVVIAGFTVLWFVAMLGLVASNTCVVTLRQVAVPDRLRGRMNAAYRTLTLGVTPLAALVAGILGEAIDVRTTILTAGLLMPFPLLWVIFSPVARMRQATDAAPAPGGEQST